MSNVETSLVGKFATLDKAATTTQWMGEPRPPVPRFDAGTRVTIVKSSAFGGQWVTTDAATQYGGMAYTPVENLTDISDSKSSS